MPRRAPHRRASNTRVRRPATKSIPRERWWCGPLRADATKGFAAEHKGNGELDLRLPKLLDAVHGPTRALLHVDRRIPYRPLIEVLFTLGLAKVDRWTFVMDGLRGIELFAPNPNKGSMPLGGLASAGAPPPFSFTVLVLSSGLVVKALGMTLADDCRSPGKGVTFAPGDLAGITRCAIAIKGSSPTYASARSSTVSANPDIEFQAVVSTWDALRKGSDGAELLPDTALAVAR